MCLWVWSVAYFYIKISILDPLYSFESTVVFGTSLLIWILGLSVIAVVLFYELLVRYFEHKERTYRFKQTISQVLSHRFGNFLVAQKINLSILEERFSEEVLCRTRQNLTEMEGQFKEIMNIIDRFRPEQLEKKVIMLQDIVLSVLEAYPEEEIEGRVKLRLQRAETFANPDEARIFIQLFLDNALRYGDKTIYIRTGTYQKNPYLIMINDITKGQLLHGAGMGLIIARNVADSLNVSFTTISRKSRYFVITLWSKRRWFE